MLIHWVWELPLAIASWLFFRVMRFIIGNLYTLFLLINREKSQQWRVFSPEVLNAVLSLPVLMTKGPRWNTHAVIGTAGPIKVEKRLSLNLQTIQSSAGSWTAAVYSYPGYRTVGNLGSLQVKDGSAEWESIDLSSGYYTIGLRYYDRQPTFTMPVVQADGVEVIPAQAVDPVVNQVYETLKERDNWFYRSLHYYVYTILRLRQWLPAGWVRREFLPVGAPETRFEYGAIAHQQSLNISLHPTLIGQYNIYLTRYNRASFPLDWMQLREATYDQPMQEDGFYLLRIRPKHPDAPAFQDDWLTINIKLS
ncbi:DUF6208 family protein [Okeania sp. SIO2G5]|uniref:DUF6208 family protein n=1 Tax=Okeania sp. SIO2G5 TaxID=2607796 RepID=UPI0013C0C109|nr:DUF6208 family protein [Okeania sp. SIO2G5]NEP76565.1 hypothetical protein [Okeania sp. SIO2G5]